MLQYINSIRTVTNRKFCARTYFTINKHHISRDLVFHERVCEWNINDQRRRDIVVVFISLSTNNHRTTSTVQQRLQTTVNTDNRTATGSH